MIDHPSGGGWSQPDDDEDPLPLDLLGERYERVDILGAGGMGRVFEAYDRRLQRTVALKEVAPHLAGTPAALRLANEALLTADLEHPGIVSVHDAGRTDDGRLFYTMRLVRGRSLAERLDEVESTEDRIALLRHLHDACHAVGYAHARDVVHRDLKPANIMTGAFGETQVVDWGLARSIGAGARPAGSAGTQGFMSPESQSGDPPTPRSDVFSLGATLRDLAGPEPPPELAAIADRALAADPLARYPDAEALAQDLGRFLDGRRVSAYDYSRSELLRRLIRAYRAPLAVALVAALLLAGVASAAYLRTRAARDRAVSAEAETRQALVQADAALAASLEAQAASAMRSGRLPAAQVLASHALLHRESPIARGVLIADLSLSRPLAVEVAPLPDCAGVLFGPDELFCVTAHGLTRHTDRPTWSLEGALSGVAVVGDHVAVGRPGMAVDLVRRDTGEFVRRWEDLPGSSRLEAHPDGRRFGVANGHDLAVVDVDGARWQANVCGQAPVLGMTFSPDAAWVICLDGRIRRAASPEDIRTPLRFDTSKPGPRLAAWADGKLVLGMTKGVVEVHDAGTGEVLNRWQALDGPIDRLELVRGTSLVAISGDRGGTQFWNLDTGVEVVRLPAPTRALRVDGPNRVRVAGDDLRRWTLPQAPRPRHVRAPAGITSVAPSPDGRWLAGARGDGAVSVWDTDSGEAVLEDRWQDRVVKWVTFRADGTELLATGLGAPDLRRIRVSDWSARSERGGHARRLAPLGATTAVAVPYSPWLWVHEPDGLREVAVDWTPFDIGLPPHQEFVYLLGEGGQIGRFDDGADAVVPIAERLDARGLAASSTGLAIALQDAVVLLTFEGEEVRRLEAGAGGIVDVALSPDGKWAAAGLLDGTARLWTTEGRLVATLVGHRERVSSVAFSADGEGLFTADWKGSILRWSLADAERPAAELVAEVEATWQIDLEMVLSAGR